MRHFLSKQSQVMTTVQMLKQIRILEIIVVCILAKVVHGKSLNVLPDKDHEQQNERIKRGYSHYGGNGKFVEYFFLIFLYLN